MAAPISQPSALPVVYALPGWLKARKQPYKNARGVRVPNVTSVLRGSSPGEGLINWAWQLGREGKSLAAERDHAMYVGKIVHRRIADFLAGVEFDPRGVPQVYMDVSDVPFRKFLHWWLASGLEYDEVEESTVSESLQLGGTTDLRCHPASGPQRMVLVDFKTQADFWPEMFYQLTGGYSLLAAERTGAFPETRVVLLPKDESKDMRERIVLANDKLAVECREQFMRLFETFKATKRMEALI